MSSLIFQSSASTSKICSRYANTCFDLLAFLRLRLFACCSQLRGCCRLACLHRFRTVACLRHNAARPQHCQPCWAGTLNRNPCDQLPSPASSWSRVRVIGSWVVARKFLRWSPFASLVSVVRVTLLYNVEHLCRACDKCVRSFHPQPPFRAPGYCGWPARTHWRLDQSADSVRVAVLCCGVVVRPSE